MTEGPTHLLVVYGEWLYVKRPRLQPQVQLNQDDPMDQATIRNLEENCEELWGLLPDKPIQAIQFTYDDGYLGTTIVPIPTGAGGTIVRWNVGDQLLVIRQSNHCWAELAGDVPNSATNIILETLEIMLPAPFGAKKLYKPTVDGAALNFLYPTIVPEGLFDETITWVSVDNGIVRNGAVAAPMYYEIPSTANVHDQETADFQSQLRALFSLMEGEGIFGCDVYGQGWRPGEGWDLVVDRVPETMCKALGWESAADMLLCWCDTEYGAEVDRYEQATEFYSANGLHQEWQDRVDIHRMPLSQAVTSTSIYYDGPVAADKQRIAESIIRHAPDAGLVANWSGDIEQCIQVWQP
jgi:hypothetical protein